jgi:hypothetical protein
VTLAIPARKALCSKRDTIDGARIDLAGLDLICEHTKRQCSSELRCLVLCIAVREHARKLGHLRDPSAIGFLLELDRELHTGPNQFMPRVRGRGNETPFDWLSHIPGSPVLPQKIELTQGRQSSSSEQSLISRNFDERCESGWRHKFDVELVSIGITSKCAG